VKLRAVTKSNTKTVGDLTRESMILTRKIKDKDDERVGMAKILDDAQNEILSLNLQLNMAEQAAKKVKADNKELIDRWMTHKSIEAEEMNKQFEGRR